jgi:hypothetical protein
LDVIVVETKCSFAEPCFTFEGENLLSLIEKDLNVSIRRLNPNSIQVVTFVRYLSLISRRICSAWAGSSRSWSTAYMNMTFGWCWRFWFLWPGLLISFRANSCCSSHINSFRSITSLSRVKMISVEMMLKSIEPVGVGHFLVNLKGPYILI